MRFDQRRVSGVPEEDSFLAQYGTFDDPKSDFGAFCTPARPRKRKSFEIDCPRSTSSTDALKNSSADSGPMKNEHFEEITALKGKYEVSVHVSYVIRKTGKNTCIVGTETRS